MALIETDKIKQITASGGGTLIADAGESFLVKAIFCDPSSNDDYLVVSVDQTVVGNFRVKGKSGNHCPYPNKLALAGVAYPQSGVWQEMNRVGMPLTIPVAANQELRVSRYAETGDVAILYDQYQAGDVLETDPNGTAADVRTILKYLTYAAAIEAAGTFELDTRNGSSALPDFPLGETAPDGRLTQLLGLLAAPTAHGNATVNKGYTTYLKLIRDQEILFDPDRNGIPFKGIVETIADAANYRGAASAVGSATFEYPTPGYWFPQPTLFTPGQALAVQVTVAAGAATGIAASEVDVCLVLRYARTP